MRRLRQCIAHLDIGEAHSLYAVAHRQCDKALRGLREKRARVPRRRTTWTCARIRWSAYRTIK
jgi:hypothetical protein